MVVHASEEEQAVAVANLIALMPKGFDDVIRSNGDWYWDNERDLRRFLFARNWDVSKAQVMLQNHIDWRIEVAPQGIVDQTYFDELNSCGICFFVGYDKRGRTIAHFKLKNVPPMDKARKKALRNFYAVYFTNVSAINDRTPSANGEFINIYDMSGAGMFQLEASVMHMVANISRDQFPERLGGCYVIDPPAIARAAFAVASKIATGTAVQRTHMLAGASGRKKLIEELGIECVPESLGGMAKTVPFMEMVKRHNLWTGSPDYKGRPSVEPIVDETTVQADGG